MGRIQKGYIYEASGAFFVRYYDSEIIDKQIRRVQRSERLCSKDTGKHYAKNAKTVKLLRDRFMLTINERTPGSSPKDFTVVDFWEQKYLPFIDQNLKPSTVWGYKQIWAQHLKAHFGSMTLKQYRTHHGSAFLTGLAKTLGRHTLQHIRSLGSGVFSYAVNESGLIESNPWHDVKILGKTKVSSETKHYTLPEAESVISALADHVDCQLIVALSFFLGLRSGEIQALRWEDFTNRSSDRCGICIKNGWRMPEPHVHVLRAIGRGIVGDTKTGIAAPLPLIEPVLIPLKLWHDKSGNPTEGWVFPNSAGKPIDLKSLAFRVIVPTLKAKKVEWKGLHAGRRGAATFLTELTGNALAAKELLRHRTLRITEDKYVKKIPTALLKGIKLFEAEAMKGKDGEADGE